MAWVSRAVPAHRDAQGEVEAYPSVHPEMTRCSVLDVTYLRGLPKSHRTVLEEA